MNLLNAIVYFFCIFTAQNLFKLFLMLSNFLAHELAFMFMLLFFHCKTLHTFICPSYIINSTRYCFYDSGIPLLALYSVKKKSNFSAYKNWLDLKSLVYREYEHDYNNKVTVHTHSDETKWFIVQIWFAADLYVC